MTRRIGILGGTFDPIHLGHLAAGRAAARALSLDTVRVVPTHVPPHRPVAPAASEFHRFAMAALAALDEPGWTVWDGELRRDGPSYTFDTLTALQDEGLAASQIFFITGADAFAEVATWSRYPAVLGLAHFVVVTRPGTPTEALPARLPDVASRVCRSDALPPAGPTRVIFVHAATPDVSSTTIRRLAADGRPLDGMVSTTVARYIERHALYRPSPDSRTVGALHGQDQ
jgi:nicotinate-nucleotide adenylyltransferase